MEEPRVDAKKEGGGDDRLTDFHVSTPDDDFVFSSSDFGLLHDKLKISMEGENDFLPSESTEPDISMKNDKYNMRKSLAWDSAFFTCEGVLEPEELSSIIEAADNHSSKPRQMLSKIPEDICTSESISTFASDSLLLETLEADLFRDIRASIQKSSRVSNVRVSVESRVDEIKPTSTPRAKVTAPQRGNIAKTSLKKPTGGLQGHDKPVKLGCTGVQPRENKKTSSSVPLRPTRTIGKVSSAANATSMRQPKKILTGAGPVKSESNKLGSKRAGQVGMVSNPGSSKNIVPKRTSLKSSVRSSTATISVHSSCDSTSSSGGQHQISSFSSLQRKASRTGKIPSSTSSIQRTPPKVGLKDKVQPVASRLSAHLKSASNQSSSLSPVSSISAQSSKSSTSSITGNQQALNESRKKVEKVPSRYGPKSLAVNVSSSSTPLSGKPSGLRMPSPKIGYFDGVKTGGQTPVGGTQSRPGLSTNRVTKPGAANSSSPGVSNKSRLSHSTVQSPSKAMVRPARASIAGVSEPALVHTSSPKVHGEKSGSKMSRVSGSGLVRSKSVSVSKSSPRVDLTTARASIAGVSESALVHTSSPKVHGEKSGSKMSRVSGSGLGRSKSVSVSKSSPRVDLTVKFPIEETKNQEMSCTGEIGKKKHKDVAGLRTPFAVKNSPIDFL